MPLDDKFKQAFHSAEPVNQLRALALQLYTQGFDKAAIIDRFEKAPIICNEPDREEDEDAVMDVMDFLTGWCSPNMGISMSHQRLSDDPASPTEE